MKKVCHLTTVHQPFDVRIFQKECRSLAKAGYDVSLVAVHEKDETVDGVHVLHLPRPRGRWERWMRTREHCMKRALVADADLYHFHDPELISVGLELKKRGKRVVYDVHESHAESMLDRSYLPMALRRPMSRQLMRLEKKAGKNLDAIVAATPKIARSFTGSKVALVQNYPSEGELAPPSTVQMRDRESAVCYVGGVSLVRGAREMLDAIDLVPGAKLLIIGEYTPKSLHAELLQLPGWRQVEGLGWQDRSGVAAAMARSVAGLVLFHPLRNHVESQPNKLFEYMSAGLPVIASDFGHWRTIVSDEDCGILVDPLDPDAIAGAIRTVVEDRTAAQDMGRRGRQAVTRKYNWSTQEAVLLELYGSIIGS